MSQTASLVQRLDRSFGVRRTESWLQLMIGGLVYQAGVAGQQYGRPSRSIWPMMQAGGSTTG
jgi:hypothetical protein